MGTRELRYYQYVNKPYEVVRDSLQRDAKGVFQRATAAASTRARSLAATLRVNVGTVEVIAEVDLVVRSIEESPVTPGGSPVTHIAFGWKAAHHSEVFPTMEATLDVYPLSREETQLDFHGTYQPPFGAVGAALDAVVGHRIAEASVQRFVEDIAERLRAELAAPAASSPR